MRILGNAILTLILVALGAAPASAQSYILGQLGAAGPTGSATTGPGFAILGLPGATDIHLNGPGTTIGNVGVSAGTLSLDSSNPVAIQGNLYLGSGATATHLPQQVSGSVFTGQDALLNAADSSALKASETFAGLKATSGITSITGTETINPSPGANGVTVLDLSNINLGGDNVLTLTGGASSQYVLNVTGDITLNSGKIRLSGGLVPQDVVINDVGGGSVHTSGGLGDESVITGILLAPNAPLGFSPGLINGEVIAGSKQVQFASGASVVSPPPVIPETSPLGLVAAAGVAVLGRCVMLRRKRRHA